MLKIDRRLFANFDWAIFSLTFFIPIAGMVVLYSAGYDPDSEVNWLSWLPVEFHSPSCAKQSIFFVGGLLAMILGMSIGTNYFYRYAYFVYAVGIVLLLAVAMFGVVVNGSRRWLDLGVVNLQPAELMKMGVVLALARFLSKSLPRFPAGYRLGQLIVPAILLGVPMALIIQQPDLGTALSVGIAGGALILFMGVNPKTLVTMVVTFSVLAYPVWHLLHDYQQRRILVLFDPEVDPQGSGYHIIQSKIAVGSGEVFGKGFLKGTQTQLAFLPEHTTDFIFSVLAEEWGFVGCIFVLALYLALIAAMLRVALRSRDLFSCLIVFGVTTQIFAYAVINAGMVVGLLPVVGIPLPLFSYGGSSLISLMFSLGVVQGVSMRRMLFNTKVR